MENIEALMKRDTAGDPISGLKWTRKTTQKVADELKKFGNSVCENTVSRLLKNLNSLSRSIIKKMNPIVTWSQKTEMNSINISNNFVINAKRKIYQSSVLMS